MSLNVACVWQKRYWDNTVLVNRNCIFPRKCYVFFAADRNYPNLYSYDGKAVIDNCQTQKNGKGQVYIIPMAYLKDEGPLPAQFFSERDEAYTKYKQFHEKQKK